MKLVPPLATTGAMLRRMFSTKPPNGDCCMSVRPMLAKLFKLTVVAATVVVAVVAPADVPSGAADMQSMPTLERLLPPKTPKKQQQQTNKQN
jgi:hypothetical protein